MQTEAISRVHLVNELPKRYATWLEFYDSLPVELQSEPEVAVRETFTQHDYHRDLCPWPLHRAAEVEWLIERDFYLARVAEELLPSRFTRSQVHALTLALHTGGKYTTTGIADPDAFLKRTWAVASK